MTTPGAAETGWNARVWHLAGPIILANLSTPLVGAVDTAVVGHLPDPTLIGAVALGAVIFNFLYWGFGFLRMGTTGFVAQAHGRGDTVEARAALARALLLAGIIGAALILLQWPVSVAAFALLEGSGELEGLAAGYLRIRIWSAPAALATYAVLGCLVGLHDTRSALLVQLALNLTNVVLDLVLVWGFGLGVAGVAWATLASEYGAAALGLALVGRHTGPLLPPAGRRHLLERTALLAMARVNMNILVRTVSLLLAFGWFAAMGTRQGELVLAANAVLLHLQSFLAYGLDGFAHASEALAGSAWGARRERAFRAAVRHATTWALMVACGYVALYWLGGKFLISLITSIESVRTEAAIYLPWLIASPLLSVWSFQLDGIFIGTTRTVEMRNAMLVSLAGFWLLTLVLMPWLGNHGLWLSLMLFMVLRALTLGYYYPRLLRRVSGDTGSAT